MKILLAAMNRFSLAALALLISSVAAPMCAQAQSFSVLGVLPGSSATIPTGVSNDGTVVVGYGEGAASSSFSAQAFRWTQATGIVGLGFLAGGTSDSQALATNAQGTVVVGYSSINGARHAFRWTQAAGLVDLGFLAGGTDSVATGVSADGTVIVGTSSATGISAEAFRWTQGGMAGLGLLPGQNCQGCASFATAVNSDGTVVVGSALISTHVYEPIRWTAATGMVGLGFLAGQSNQNFGEAYAVNGDGSVVVGQGGMNVNNLIVTCQIGQAFRWTQPSGMVGLGFLPTGNFSCAQGASADGSVLVGSSNTSTAPNGVATRWTTSSGWQPIQDLLTQAGINLTGWKLTNATGVSADGQTVVGYGSDPLGRPQAWIAKLPPPPALRVSPVTDIVASGHRRGAFSPKSFSYQLSATSGAVNFSISQIPIWLTASFTSGAATVSPLTVTFTLRDVSALKPGTYHAVIVFTNTTNGQGNTTRTATLKVLGGDGDDRGHHGDKDDRGDRDRDKDRDRVN